MSPADGLVLRLVPSPPQEEETARPAPEPEDTALVDAITVLVAVVADLRAVLERPLPVVAGPPPPVVVPAPAELAPVVALLSEVVMRLASVESAVAAPRVRTVQRDPGGNIIATHERLEA